VTDVRARGGHADVQVLGDVGRWLDRSADIEGSIQLIGPFAAGAAAWIASREHHRSMGDLLASTPRNPWARTTAAWLISLGWLAGFYVAMCTVFLAVTATQATWGEPDLWPAVAGLVALIMCSARGTRPESLRAGPSTGTAGGCASCRRRRGRRSTGGGPGLGDARATRRPAECAGAGAHDGAPAGAESASRPSSYRSFVVT
jgi:hypothetical protein